jgi:hypothetical protein
MHIGKIVLAGVISAVLPAAQAAAFAMGGAPGAGVGLSMSNSGSMANGGNASYAHGSPAATNPAVAAMEARQRDAQVAAEIEQARRAGRNVSAAEAARHKGEAALAANQADQAMLRFSDAERDLGIVANNAAMGAYSKSLLGSVTSGGTDLSGAVVH